MVLREIYCFSLGPIGSFHWFYLVFLWLTVLFCFFQCRIFDDTKTESNQSRAQSLAMNYYFFCSSTLRHFFFFFLFGREIEATAVTHCNVFASVPFLFSRCSCCCPFRRGGFLFIFIFFLFLFFFLPF